MEHKGDPFAPEPAITRPFAIDAPPHVPAQPRAMGHVRLAVDGAGLRDLRQAGALRVLFPRDAGGRQAMLVNTAGGITGGDRFDIEVTVGVDADLTLTTQAAERAYRAQAGEVGRVATLLSVSAGARAAWLPQEMILYDRCALDRRLHVDLAHDGRLLLAEPVVFGRTAMGEVLRHGSFRDRISIDRGGVPLYRDALYLTGDIAARLGRMVVAGGAVAMASLVHIAPDAPGRLVPLRRMLGSAGGVSLIGQDMLVMRLLAADSYLLRRTLIPVLEFLTADALPMSWRL